MKTTMTNLLRIAIIVGSSVLGWSCAKFVFGQPQQRGYTAVQAGSVAKIDRAQQGTAANSSNTRTDLTFHPDSWDKHPHALYRSEHSFILSQPMHALLAGDAAGTKGWSVDNFLLIEVLDSEGRVKKMAEIGCSEPLYCNDNPVPEIGPSSFSFNKKEIDLRSILPLNTPFTLRVTAMDYGSAANCSDVFIRFQGADAESK